MYYIYILYVHTNTHPNPYIHTLDHLVMKDIIGKIIHSQTTLKKSML